MSSTNIYPFILLLASLFSTGAVIEGWNRRSHPAAKWMLGFMGGTAIWSFTYALFWVAGDPRWKYIWLNMTYFGVVVVPTAFFLFAIVYTGRVQSVSKRILYLLSIQPVLTLIILWTDPLHNWFFGGLRTSETSSILKGGWYFYLHVGYSYLLLLIATILLIEHIATVKQIFRWQSLLLFFAMLLPWGMNILEIIGLSLLPELDVTPLIFVFTGMIMLLDLRGWRLLDVVPIARSQLVEHMDDGVVVLDSQNRIIDFNPAARILETPENELELGKPIFPLLARFPNLAERFLVDSMIHQEIRLGSSQYIYLDLRIKPLFDNKGELVGRLMTWRNVTERKKAELELQNAHRQLQKKMEEIEILQEKLREQAIRDPVTGVYNRRYLDEVMRTEIERARRNNTTLALAIMDLDDFKLINDTFGHAAGDTALQEVANILQRNIRAYDILCRYGGEEFIVLMPDMVLGAAEKRAKTWREKIEKHTIVYGSFSFNVTISIGVAIFPYHAQNDHELFRAADDALYTAKQDGKNRVVVFSKEASKPYSSFVNREVPPPD